MQIFREQDLPNLECFIKVLDNKIGYTNPCCDELHWLIRSITGHLSSSSISGGNSSSSDKSSSSSAIPLNPVVLKLSCPVKRSLNEGHGTEWMIDGGGGGGG